MCQKFTLSSQIKHINNKFINQKIIKIKVTIEEKKTTSYHTRGMIDGGSEMESFSCSHSQKLLLLNSFYVTSIEK